MTIGDRLAEQARLRPDAVALVDERTPARPELTYAVLADEVERAAAWWAAAGIRRGSAVLVLVPLSVDLYVVLLALFRLGATAMIVDPSAGQEHLERCCARLAPAAFIGPPRAHVLRLAAPAIRRIPLKIVLGGWVPGARRWPRPLPADRPPEAPVAPSDAALVTFTSGSTGEPKAAVRTHAFLIAQHRALEPALALAPGEVDLVTLPVFTLANLASGVTSVIPPVDLRRPGAVPAAPLVDVIRRRGVTRITASPALFERLVAHGVPLPGLRKIFTGGAPVFPRLLGAVQALAPNARVVAVYGSTEAEPVAHVGREEISAADRAAMAAGGGLLAGRPEASLRVRVLRDRWGEERTSLTAAELAAETVAAGEPGEIVVAGDHVVQGYLGGVGERETKFRVDGEVWHRTGDAGRWDAAGRLWLLGRCSARLADARGPLYPFTVECAAMECPDVRRVAALGLGARRLLVVEADRTEALALSLRQAVAWAGIDEIRFVPHLPVDRRHNAKIDYPALRRMVGG